MSKEIDRRRFVSAAATGAAAIAIAPADLFAASVAPAQPNAIPSWSDAITKATPPASFGPMKQIDAGLLNIGYAEAGPANGPAVLLLHGWPYDIHSFVDVAPLLASAGHRVIVPYLRGYGTTRFLSSETRRNAQQSAVALDIIALMDALKIQTATVGGFDWGARTADVMAALWPERCKAIVSVSGYLISTPAGNKTPWPPEPALLFWYQYYFATPVGKAGYAKYVDQFNKFIWHQASPNWNFDDATYNRTAASFTNPDHVDIVMHDYRWRLGLADGEAKYDALEKRLAAASAHHRAHDHYGRRRQRRNPRDPARRIAKVLGQIRVPPDHRRRRPQPAAGSTASLRQGGDRRRRFVIGVRPLRPAD